MLQGSQNKFDEVYELQWCQEQILKHQAGQKLLVDTETETEKI